MNSNELYHYGVKGMHWGEWNEETAARYNSGKVSNYGKNGGILKKESIVSRVALTKNMVFRKMLTTNIGNRR